MRTNEIRSLFLDYFSGKDHLVVPSYSLIPQDDPTLLLIGAGMAPLKPYFTGEKSPPHTRMATCQKCVRTPDIELVGITGRHATFFEMLGNFSFGDYFKEEAIAWAWEFVTRKLRLPVEKLWITIYEEDQEAFDIWHKDIGLPAERIIRMGKEDNFWEIGTGPCGPCTEIHYDLGEEVGCKDPGCKIGCDCDRFLEIWNLVFTQFNRMPDGSLEPLEQKNIDTGAGLERLAMVLQGVSSFFEIDTVRPLVDYISDEALAGTEDNRLSRRIVAEHLRGITFMIADGVLPSNEGRGYVLRRLLRRAIRHGRLLGIDDPFLFRAVPLVVSLLGDAYPELKERQEYITQIIELEENRFRETLNQGMEILDNYLKENMPETPAGSGSQNGKVFPGELAFRLYDTYGFPLDLTREILAEKNLTVDEEAFNLALEEQKNKARNAHRKSAGGGNREEKAKCWEEIRHLSTSFEGYDKLETSTRVLAICKNSQLTEEVSEGEEAEIVVEQTPFYAESGGQTGDTGLMEGEGFVFSVTDTYFNSFDQIVHRGKVTSGSLKKDSEVRCLVDVPRREAIRRSHTATHLLHRVLKEYLGEHVNQAGSQVVPDRLRLDFTHFNALSDVELQEIEAKLNRLIRESLPVRCRHTSLKEAREMGAVALFDEKYGNNVRVISIGDESMELCGGTHLDITGQAGMIRIIREESIGAGVRRIEALTGEEVWNHVVEQENRLKRIARVLKTTPEQVDEKVNDWMEENRRLQQDYQDLQSQVAAGQADNLLNHLKQNGDIQIISNEVTANNMDSLREMADRLKEKLTRGVVVLGAVNDGKVMLVSAVTKDLIPEGIHAGNLISGVARQVGGGGGGRPDMAQAGGKNPAALPEALQSVESLVEEQHKKTESKT